MSSEPFRYPFGTLIPGTKYEVVRVLGAGGMGTVYEVEDTTIDKRYVLKTLHANLSTRDDLVERMRREAKALAQLEHKNVVQVITADVTSDSFRLPYFVMEKLHGHSLRTVLDNKGRLEVDASCRIVIDLLNALYHAHEHRIIHRDVKPENIFLHRDLEGVTVTKLLDFGVMTRADAKTMTGHRFIGTLRYAAPEQLSGEKVSAQTDLYAAALVLFECISGSGPFDEAGDGMQIAGAHLNLPAPRLSSRVPGVPAALDEVIASALEKNPRARPVDAFSFAAELHRLRKALKLPHSANVSMQATELDPMQLELPPRTSPRAASAVPAAAGPASDPTSHEGAMRGVTEPADGGGQGGTTPVDAEHTTRRERPAPARVAGVVDATEHQAALASLPRGGATLEDAGPRSDMSVGAAVVAAAIARSTGRSRPDGAEAAGVDRNAPTGTYAPPPQWAQGLPGAGSGGDTDVMRPIEQRNLAPAVEGAMVKTTRLEPIPEAFTSSSPGYTSGAGWGSTGSQVGAAPASGTGSGMRWVLAGVGVMAVLAVVAGLGIYALRARSAGAAAAGAAASAAAAGMVAPVTAASSEVERGPAAAPAAASGAEAAMAAPAAASGAEAAMAAPAAASATAGARPTPTAGASGAVAAATTPATTRPKPRASATTDGPVINGRKMPGSGL